LSTFAGLQVRNTRNLIDETTRFCGLVYQRPKFGKTTFGATMDAMTKKYMGKPTLFVAIEQADGGGTMSIQDYGVDFVQPKDFNELSRVLAALQTDTTYGGIVFDSGSEYAKQFLQPFAMKFPSKQRTPQRTAGVPEWGDYQVMGEQGRIHFNQLIALTAHRDLNIRKHLLVTALYKERSDDNGNVIKIYPDLPGALADTATAMFQTVGIIAIKNVVVPDPKDPKKTIREKRRSYVTEQDGIAVLGDRTHMLPADCPLDFLEIWDKHWMPKLTAMKVERQEATKIAA
jgi:hypothetical protein